MTEQIFADVQCTPLPLKIYVPRRGEEIARNLVAACRLSSVVRLYKQIPRMTYRDFVCYYLLYFAGRRGSRCGSVRSRSDSPLDCHSLRSRRFATSPPTKVVFHCSCECSCVFSKQKPRDVFDFFVGDDVLDVPQKRTITVNKDGRRNASPTGNIKIHCRGDHWSSA